MTPPPAFGRGREHWPRRPTSRLPGRNLPRLAGRRPADGSRPAPRSWHLQRWAGRPRGRRRRGRARPSPNTARRPRTITPPWEPRETIVRPAALGGGRRAGGGAPGASGVKARAGDLGPGVPWVGSGRGLGARLRGGTGVSTPGLGAPRGGEGGAGRGCWRTGVGGLRGLGWLGPAGARAGGGRYLWQAPRWSCRCRWCRECPRSGSAPWR